MYIYIYHFCKKKYNKIFCYTCENLDYAACLKPVKWFQNCASYQPIFQTPICSKLLCAVLVHTYIHTYVHKYMNYGVPYCLYDRYGEYIILEFICDVTKIQLNVTYNLIKTILQLLSLSCFQPSIFSWILTINLGSLRFRAPCFTEPTQ